MLYFANLDIESQPYLIIATSIDELMNKVAEFFYDVVRYGLDPEKYVDQIVEMMADFESAYRLLSRGFIVEYGYPG